MKTSKLTKISHAYEGLQRNIALHNRGLHSLRGILLKRFGEAALLDVMKDLNLEGAECYRIVQELHLPSSFKEQSSSSHLERKLAITDFLGENRPVSRMDMLDTILYSDS